MGFRPCREDWKPALETLTLRRISLLFLTNDIGLNWCSTQHRRINVEPSTVINMMYCQRPVAPPHTSLSPSLHLTRHNTTWLHLIPLRAQLCALVFIAFFFPQSARNTISTENCSQSLLQISSPIEIPLRYMLLRCIRRHWHDSRHAWYCLHNQTRYIGSVMHWISIWSSLEVQCTQVFISFFDWMYLKVIFTDSTGLLLDSWCLYTFEEFKRRKMRRMHVMCKNIWNIQSRILIAMYGAYPEYKTGC